MTSFPRIAHVSVAIATLAVFPSLGAYAASGLSYGSVTKFSAGGDAPAGPGSYRTDFETAANPQSAGSTPHAPFGLGKMLAKAQSAVAMLKNGTAEKYYVGTTKERVDNIGMQTADITDCSARTLTHLDLDKKTYSVVSLDRPETPAAPSGSHRSAPAPQPSDDGTKVALAITTRALGPMTIDGVATNGYDTNVKMTATKPSGESSTSDMNVTAYYSAIEEPRFGCGANRVATSAPPGAAASLASIALAMKAMHTPKGDARFSVTSSGPPVPTNRFSMWQSVVMMAGTQQKGGFSVITERGDVHAPIGDSDPVFSVPAGFTKIDA